jgi:hypothetical protein
LTASIITDDFDEACAKLKADLEAQDAMFKANLEAQFKSARPTAPAAGPHASAGWALAVNRNRWSDYNDSGSGRG